MIKKNKRVSFVEVFRSRSSTGVYAMANVWSFDSTAIVASTAVLKNVSPSACLETVRNQTFKLSFVIFLKCRDLTVVFNYVFKIKIRVE